MNKVKVVFEKGWNSPTLMTWGNLISSSGKLLILTPLILVKYNIDEIAFWYLLLTINSLAIVIDFGFYPTFSRIISYAFNGLDKIMDISGIRKGQTFSSDGKPSWKFLQSVYGTLNVIYVSLAVIVGIGVLALSYFSVNEIISRTNDGSSLWLAYILFVFSIVFNFLARRSDAVIIGTNHVALIQRWNIANNLLNSLSSILIVWLGLSIEYLALNQLFFSVLLVVRNLLIEWNICEGRFKEFVRFDFKMELFRWIWEPTWKSGVLVIASTGLTQITGIIYSTMSNSSELAAYLLTLKLITTISQFSQAPFYSKLPVFNGLRVSGNLYDMQKMTQSAMLKSLMVFVCGVAVLIFFGNEALALIGSNSTIESSKFIIVMSLVWFLERHHAMHAQIYVTTNKIPFYKSAIVTAVLNISLMLVLIPIFGVWAFPLSQGLANLAINNWWNVKLSLKSLDSSFFEYFKKSSFYPAVFFLLMCIVYYISNI